MIHNEKRQKIPLTGNYGEFFLYRDRFVNRYGFEEVCLSLAVLLHRGKTIAYGIKVSGALTYALNKTTEGLWAEQEITVVPLKDIIDEQLQGLADLQEEDIKNLYSKCFDGDMNQIPRPVQEVNNTDLIVIDNT